MRLIIMMLMFLNFVGMASAGDLRNAMRADDAGDYALAANLYTALAENGDPIAQHNLAIMYEQGKHFKRSYKDAFYWFLEASKSGNKQSLFQVGNMYQFGRGVKEDIALAVDFYLRAAAAGSGDAHLGLGDLYLRGDHFEANLAVAFDHWVKSVELTNNPMGAYNAGLALFKGDGVPINLAKAYEFFEIAAKQNHSGAMYFLGNYFDAALGQKARDKKMAAYWYRKAAGLGNRPAMHNLANMYLKGEGVRPDEAAALALYEEAAHLGFAQSQFNLSAMLNAGVGNAKNLEKAAMWLLIAKMNGFTSGNLEEDIFSKFDTNKITQITSQAKKCLFSSYDRSVCKG